MSKFPLPVSHCRCTVFCVPQPCSDSSWPCRIQPALDPESSILVFDQAPSHFSLPCSPRPMAPLNTANNLNYNLANFKVLNSNLKEYKGVFYHYHAGNYICDTNTFRPLNYFSYLSLITQKKSRLRFLSPSPISGQNGICHWSHMALTGACFPE